MRNVIVAVLALSPLMIHAQAAKPAQPQTADAASVRVSTVHEAKLIHTVEIQAVPNLSTSPLDKTIDISMNIDETGKPSDLKIVGSANPIVDQKVLDAVSQYRYTPATLNDQPVTVAANLHVVLHNPAQ
jgi:outer membrane biosynthesis protein TonB